VVFTESGNPEQAGGGLIVFPASDKLRKAKRSRTMNAIGTGVTLPVRRINFFATSTSTGFAAFLTLFV